MKKEHKRINAIVDLVEKEDTILDIGTDHAYVPIFIALKKITTKPIYASEINPNPFEVAKKNIEKYNLKNNINLFLSDGTNDINNFNLLKIDVFIIAGLGGTSIINILNNTKNNLNKLPKKLILHPTNADNKLRKWLKFNAYKIVEEKFVVEKNKKTSIIIKAVRSISGYFLSSKNIVIGPILSKKAYYDSNIFDYYKNRKEYLFSIYEKSKKMKHLNEYKKFNNIIKLIEGKKEENEIKKNN